MAGEQAAACQGGGGGNMLFLILMSSGVTCAALLYDFVHRYVIRRGADDTPKGDAASEKVTSELKVTLGRLQELESERKRSVKLEREERLRERQKEKESLFQLTERITQVSQSQIVTSSAAPSLQQATPTSASSPAPATDDVPGEYGLRWLLCSLVDVMRSSVQLYSGAEAEGVSEECRQQLEGIAALEEPCNSLSVEFDKCAVLLSNRNAEDDADKDVEDDASLALYQARRSAVRSQWTGVRRLLYCVDVHLKNAANYDQFYFELAELQKIFDRFNAKVTEALSTDVAHVTNLTELKELEATAQRTMRQLEQWEGTLARLDEECRLVVPVHMRTQPLEEPVTARALCTYQRDGLSVTEGDIITLESNEDAYEWKVSTVSGASGILPAVTVLIPPPDAHAGRELGRVRQGLREAYVSLKIHFQRRLMGGAADVIADILENKRHCIAVIHPGNKEKMLDDLDQLADVCSQYCSNDEDWPQLQESIEELRKAIVEAEEEGEEAECLQEVMEMLSTLATIATEYKTFVSTLESHKTLHFHKARDETSPAGSEWDTLDDLEAAKREMTLGVKVRRESEQIGKTSTYESASGETRSTFSIRAVLDTRDGAEISMDEAIRKGIVDQSRGVYINPSSGEEVPIPVAMSQGFILVESTQTQKTRELKRAVGIVTVKVMEDRYRDQYTRETRPYSVKAILDPRNDDQLSVSKAIEEGIYDPKREMWCNPDTGEEMSVENAIDCGAFLVDYDTDAEVTEPEVSEKTFAVFGVLDRKQGKRLPFHEASERGLIDKEEGIYTDSLTGETMHVIEAFKKNYVKARVIEDPKQLEAYLHEPHRSRDSSMSDN